MALHQACPHCGGFSAHGNGTFRWKDGTRRQRYLCRSCGRTFNGSTGTPLWYLKKRTEWDRQSSVLAHGLSVRAMASFLGVTVTTAFYWRHRLLRALCHLSQPRLAGAVAVAEAYVSYSEKGSRKTAGPGAYGVAKATMGALWWDGHRSPLSQRFRRLKDGKATCVLLASTGAQDAAVVVGPGKPTVACLGDLLPKVLLPKAVLWSWGAAQYAKACKHLGMAHQNAWEQQEAIRTPHLRGTGRLLRGLYGWLRLFRGVATRYLPNYVAWYRFVFGIGTAKSADRGRQMVNTASLIVQMTTAT